jgi:NADH-quinone oxidoreductase subunit F
MGGPSGGCLPKDCLDLPIEYESITQTGAIIGSGGMVVMDDNNCMVNMAKFFLEFTCEESCGKCTYCRVGNKRMLEILERITQGKGQSSDIALLKELSKKTKEGSLCGLGQTAPNPILTTLKYFEEEYHEHINEGYCASGTCKALITYTIDEEKCIGCTACQQVCPVDAINGNVKQSHRIDQTLCITCGNCFETCKFDAIEMT